MFLHLERELLIVSGLADTIVPYIRLNGRFAYNLFVLGFEIRDIKIVPTCPRRVICFSYSFSVTLNQH